MSSRTARLILLRLRYRGREAHGTRRALHHSIAERWRQFERTAWRACHNRP